MLKPRTLFVSDLDGTLLNSHSQLSQGSIEMLGAALERGALFTIATARTPATLISMLSPIEMRLPGVVMTGAALFDFSAHTFSRVCHFPPGVAESMLPLYRRHGVATFVYTMEQNLLDVYHIGELNQYEKCFIAERSHTPVKRFHVPADGESVLPASLDKTVLMFSVQPWEKAYALYEEIKERRVPVTPLCYHDAFGPDWGELEMFGPTTSKAAAVEAVASQCAAGRIVAFGDNVNDLPLFSIADRAIAVENAIPELKEHATDIIGPNTADSVAAYILDHC